MQDRVEVNPEADYYPAIGPARVATQGSRCLYSGMEFSAKLTKLRTDRRLSQEELGAMVGLHQSRVSKWENGEGIPTMPQALRLARALGVGIEFLADDSLDTPAAVVEPEELILLRVFRRLQIGVEEAAERLLCPPGMGFVGSKTTDALKPRGRKPKRSG